MTKAQLISKLNRKISTVDRDAINVVVSQFLETIKEQMAEGNNIYLRGFGSFITKKRAAKIGRNIRKGNQIEIPERFVPAFKPSKDFMEVVKESEKVKAAYEAERES